jgi:hypothetical protein
MRYSVAMSNSMDAELQAHLLQHGPEQEDVCFALWSPSEGNTRYSGLINRVLLPERGERLLHGNTSFLPEYFDRALAEAMAAKRGLALLHSHPAGALWQGMSADDTAAERGRAPAAKALTGLPLLGMTLAGDGSWSARFWPKRGPRNYRREDCASVRVVGQELKISFNDELLPPEGFRPELTRTVSAWGPRVQAKIARLKVGIVGLGSVGSLVAESLARMGVGHISLIDFDSIERINLDRVLHSKRSDVKRHRSKIDIAKQSLVRSATAARLKVVASEDSIVEEAGFRVALDCDVLFSCVDRPWPRSVLNFIAYAHLIPVVDGGLAIMARPNGLGLYRADWKVHVAAPSRQCLECLKQYDSGFVAMERDGYLDDPEYIAGLPNDHPAKRNENVFAFSMAAASAEVLQFLSMVVAPFGIADPGTHMYHFVTASFDVDHGRCAALCAFPPLTALGDQAPYVVTGKHIRAEAEREKRNRWWRRLRRSVPI